MRSRSSVLAAALVVAAAFVPVLVLADPTPASSGKTKPPSSSQPIASSSSSSAPILAMSADVISLYGSNGGGGIDPKIGNVPQLKSPPFSSYDTYKLLAETRLPLAPGKTSDTQLPNGRTLQITLKGPAERERFKVGTGILEKNGAPFLPALDVTMSLDEWFFVGGQRYRDGMLFVGLKLVK